MKTTQSGEELSFPVWLSSYLFLKNLCFFFTQNEVLQIIIEMIRVIYQKPFSRGLNDSKKLARKILSVNARLALSK